MVNIKFDDGNEIQCDSYSYVTNKVLKLLFYSDLDKDTIIDTFTNADCSKFTIHIIGNNRDKKIRFVNYKLSNIINNIIGSSENISKSGKAEYTEVFFIKE